MAAIAPAGLTEAGWAARAGISRGGGAWVRRRKRYRNAGLIEERDGRWYATDTGVAQAGADAPAMPAPGKPLVEWWARRLRAPGRILKLLADVHPRALTRDAIAGDLAMSAAGGAFNRYIAELKAAELVVEKGKRLSVASDVMGPA